MLVAACRFNGAPGGAGADASPDAATDGPVDAGTDADLVCDTMTLNLTIDGVELTDFSTDLPYAVGDSIRLNAGASCSPTGNLTFAWDLGGGDFVSRSPALDDFFIEIYPDAAGDLSLSITIDDGKGAPLTRAIPIAGVGFAALEVFGAGNTGVVSEMVIGDGRLWLASDQGAVSQDVAMLDTAPYEGVNTTAGDTDPDLTGNITDVAYDGDNNVVSFLPDDGSALLFYDREADAINALTPVDTGLTGTLVDVMPLANGGVRTLSTLQVDTSDYSTFTLEWNRDQAVAVTVQGADILAGGTRLFRRMNAVNSEEREIFGAADDDGIVTFFQDADGALWIGSGLGDADTGIGVIDDFNDATVTEHLLGERIRSIGQDAAGDMWVATENGVFRFKSDWDVWIQLGARHGLTTVNSHALLVDEAGGQNRILVGTATDLFVLDRP